METTPGRRIQQWREFKKLSITDLHRLTGINVTTISQAETPKGKVSNPSYDTLTKMLAAFPDLSPDWLLFGNGHMLRDGRALSLASPPQSIEPAETAPAGAGISSNVETVSQAESVLALARAEGMIEQLQKENDWLRGVVGKTDDSSDAADEGDNPGSAPKPTKGPRGGRASNASLVLRVQVRGFEQRAVSFNR